LGETCVQGLTLSMSSGHRGGPVPNGTPSMPRKYILFFIAFLIIPYQVFATEYFLASDVSTYSTETDGTFGINFEPTTDIALSNLSFYFSRTAGTGNVNLYIRRLALTDTCATAGNLVDSQLVTSVSSTAGWVTSSPPIRVVAPQTK